MILLRTHLLLACIGTIVPGSLETSRGANADSLDRQAGYVSTEFLPSSGKPFNHASSIVETKGGKIVAWVSGSEERAKDVSIWTSRESDGAWTKPVEVTQGFLPNDERHYPCWNPVLFRPRQGPLFLFYKVGNSPESWSGVVMISYDDGRTWGGRRLLPAGIYGPIRNKPVQLDDETFLCGSSSEDAGWRVHMEMTSGLAQRWTRTGELNKAREVALIQPAILTHRRDGIQILCRSKQGYIFQSFSQDKGKTWTPATRTPLPNPNSAIDAVTLKDERSLVVYNHSQTDRSPLNVAVSNDGRTWRAALVLESQPGEFAYPSVIQDDSGLVHVTYTWNKEKIKHATLDPERFEARLMTTARN